MKTKTMNTRNVSIAAAQSLLAGQRKQAGYTLPEDFFLKCDTRTLTPDEALGYLGNAAQTYPVDASMHVVEDVTVDTVIDPYSAIEKAKRRIADPGSDGCSRLRFRAGAKVPVLDRLLAFGDVGKVKIVNSTVHQGEVANVYAGVATNGQVFRVGTMLTTALAICAAIPEAKPVFIVVPIDGFEEA